jgi:hypothetical protein
MEFDHRDPREKIDSVSKLVGHGAHKDKILREIAKCDLVCANCHRIRSLARLQHRGTGKLAAIVA